MTFNAFEQISKMQEQLQMMGNHIAELDKKVDAIQSSEAELAIPMSEEASPTLTPPSPAPSSDIKPPTPSAE